MSDEITIRTGCAQRDHFVTTQPLQVLTGPHRSTFPTLVSVSKHMHLQEIKNTGEGLKIRRYLVPWWFDSPSRHQQLLFLLNDLQGELLARKRRAILWKSGYCSKTVVVLEEGTRPVVDSGLCKEDSTVLASTPARAIARQISVSWP